MANARKIKYKGLILWKQYKHSEDDSMDYITQFRLKTANKVHWYKCVTKIDFGALVFRKKKQLAN